MGITGLFSLIKSAAPDAIRTVPVSDLESLRIGIDASINIYQWYATGGNRTDARGKPCNHLLGALSRVTVMLELGIVPVYVFDGPPPAVKADTIADRQAARDNGRALVIPREAFDEVKHLIQLMGVTCVQSPGEGEAQCAWYSMADHIDAVATEDIDCLVFGAKFMIRGLNATAKTVTLIDRAAVLAGFGLTDAEFVDLAILMGCDYTVERPSVGPARALRLMREYHSIEAIFAAGELVDPEEFDYVAARAEFANPTGITDDLGDITPTPPGEALDEYLTSLGLTSTRINNVLKRLASTVR